MSHNLIINGIEYSPVNKLSVPDTEGNTVEFITPTGNINITANGEYDVAEFAKAEVNVPVPDNYIDTSDATADAYTICIDKTAYVNGQRVTGAYTATPASGSQYNCNSSGCSTSELVIPCPFEPQYCCVILNSETHNTNTVISAMFYKGAVTYHSRTSSGVVRTQTTTNLGNYWSYDSTNKMLTLKRPNTTYSWSNLYYRIFAFK